VTIRMNPAVDSAFPDDLVLQFLLWDFWVCHLLNDHSVVGDGAVSP